MAFTGIGDINLQIAEQKAQNVEKTAESKRKLIGGIGESINTGIDQAYAGTETAMESEVKVQKLREADELLKSGSKGIKAYANELGLDPSLYVNMADNVKNPEGFKNIYVLMKKKSEKDSEESSVLSFAQKIEQLGAIDDDATFERAKNSLVPEAAAGGKSAQDRKLKLLKELEQNRIAKGKSGKSPNKDIIDLRKLFSSESKNISEILRQTGVLRSAFSSGSFNGNRVGSDQALIMTFNKILDPTSVVRESEFARTGQSQGAVDAAAGWFKKLVEGGSGLTEDGRKAVFKMSELISQGTMIDMFMKIEEFGELDSDNLERIVPGFKKYESAYDEWRSNPEGYKDRITDELNKTLNEAKNGETAKGSSKQPSGSKAKKPARRKATAEDFK